MLLPFSWKCGVKDLIMFSAADDLLITARGRKFSTILADPPRLDLAFWISLTM